jgi:hypothetical protein
MRRTKQPGRRRQLWIPLVSLGVGLSVLTYWLFEWHVRFDMSVIGGSVSQRAAGSDPIHHGHSEAVEGSQIVLRLSTDIDLEKVAPQLTHHLYFKLFVAGQDDFAWSLWTGSVFRARPDPAAIRRDGEHLYEVHIPVDVKKLVAHASGYGSVDIESYVEAARSGKLCVAVGGAMMWGIASLWGTAEAPLVIKDDGLQLQ